MHPLQTKVIISSTQNTIKHECIVDLAITPEERYKGLSGRKTLSDDRGMLFVFDHKEKYGFVMRNMNFPLDFLWIDGNAIVDITENAPIDSYEPLTSYQPRQPVDKVLELPAGTVNTHGIQIGDIITIDN